MFAAGVLGTLYAAGLMASGSLYVGVFDGVDATTLLMLGILLAMLGWLGAGFPQLFDVIQAPPELAAQGFEIPPQIVMAEPLRIGVWLVNRFAKASLFLAFFFVFRTQAD